MADRMRVTSGMRSRITAAETPCQRRNVLDKRQGAKLGGSTRLEHRGQVRRVRTARWHLPGAGGQRLGHQAVRLMFLAEEVAEFVRQDRQQVPRSLPALVAGVVNSASSRGVGST